MYIDNGSNQGYSTNVIVVSSDGIRWDQIQKSRITAVDSRENLNWNLTGVRPYQFNDLLRVIIKDSGSSVIIDFDIQEVVNQPTWTPNPQGLTQCVLDISSWL